MPMVEPRVAPMLDDRGARPTIVAQIPPPIGRQARQQQGTLPMPQVFIGFLLHKYFLTLPFTETALSSSTLAINGDGRHRPVLHEGDERHRRPPS